MLTSVQFLVFLVSIGFVPRYLATGQRHDAAAFSEVLQTLTLHAIMSNV